MSNQEKQPGSIKQMKVSTMLSRILSESLLVAKDFHHEFFTPEHVLATAIRDEFVEQLLQNSAYREIMQADYAQVRALLGGKGASEAVAKAMIKELKG